MSPDQPNAATGVNSAVGSALGRQSVMDTRPEVLWLRVEAALTVVPLIASLVAGTEDRGVIVADVVTCWLALPPETRDRYRNLAGSGSSGLEQFGWDYIDAVEQRFVPEGEAMAGVSAETAEQAAYARWHGHLGRIRPARACANSFPMVR